MTNLKRVLAFAFALVILLGIAAQPMAAGLDADIPEEAGEVHTHEEAMEAPAVKYCPSCASIMYGGMSWDEDLSLYYRDTQCYYHIYHYEYTCSACHYLSTYSEVSIATHVFDSVRCTACGYQKP